MDGNVFLWQIVIVFIIFVIVFQLAVAHRYGQLRSLILANQAAEGFPAVNRLWERRGGV